MNALIQTLTVIAQAEATQEVPVMTTAGWILLICSNLAVLSLAGFCFYKVLSVPEEHMHSLTDIDPHDQDTSDSDSDD